MATPKHIQTTKADRADWRRLEDEVREQVRATLIEAEHAPVPFGEFVAWTGCQFGFTDHLGVVHRAGEWDPDRPTTLCGEAIPPIKRRLVLTPRFIRTLGRCRYCETVYAQKGAAA